MTILEVLTLIFIGYDNIVLKVIAEIWEHGDVAKNKSARV